MKNRKALNFDLSTNELKKHFNSTAEAYSQIKIFMIENGFEHRQYSGYISKEPMNEREITKLVRKLNKQLSWLSTCVLNFDVTDIGEQHDLTHLLTGKKSKIAEFEISNESNEAKKTELIRKHR
ncbi:VapD family protein [Helicobacter fennelliae]|uniref:Virulence-associated protein 2 n=2 Tax=Helicobacter fennelliae TaxID=215 RepID=T1DVG3_9HELI|nr:VapD family protein [Helicobacter fennelliae]GAD18517.1 virulence-associated protein 2 [Helicobacter fennelliae MRY12-0050]SQB98779.1 virulence associated protein D [Helicobacter fennelliae]STP08122.1 virulence associated protein D [Helicobacter fennelliae]